MRLAELKKLHDVAYALDSRYRECFERIEDFIREIVSRGEGMVNTPFGEFSCVYTSKRIAVVKIVYAHQPMECSSRSFSSCRSHH